MSNKSTQFKPGQSGNPKGAPRKEWTAAGLIRDAMNDKILNPEGKKEVAKKIVYRKLVKLAAEGDVVAIKEINNRIDGLPQESIKHSGSIEFPTPIYAGRAKDSI